MTVVYVVATVVSAVARVNVVGVFGCGDYCGDYCGGYYGYGCGCEIGVLLHCVASYASWTSPYAVIDEPPPVFALECAVLLVKCFVRMVSP